MPLSVVAGIDINLSPELMTAVKAATYSNSAKMGLAMRRRFWEEDDQIFGGHLYSNLPLGEFSYPSNGYFSKKGVLLGLYTNGPVGDLIDRPVAARVEHVLMHASKVHPQIRQEFESAYAVWWRKVKYQPGRLRVGRLTRTARGAHPRGQPHPHRLGRHRSLLDAGLAGGRGGGGLEGTRVAARTRHARVTARTKCWAKKTLLHGATHVKLEALVSLPAAPVNFGHRGHSHSGRERLTFVVPVDWPSAPPGPGRSPPSSAAPSGCRSSR